MKIGDFEIPSIDYPRDIVTKEEEKQFVQWAQRTIDAVRNVVFCKTEGRPIADGWLGVNREKIGRFTVPSYKNMKQMSLEEVKQIEYFIEHVHMLRVGHVEEVKA